jgi:hypothetical protein
MKIPSRLRRASAEGGEGSAAQQAGGEESFGKRGGTPLVGGFEHDYGGWWLLEEVQILKSHTSSRKN